MTTTQRKSRRTRFYNQACQHSLEFLESRLLLSNDWQGTGTGNWSTDGNWTLGHKPTAAEDVVINYAADITMNGPPAAATPPSPPSPPMTPTPSPSPAT